MRELAEELREYTAMKYAGDCKCGKCQLVPRELVERIYHTLNGSAGHAQTPPDTREALLELYQWCCDLNDFRPDSRLGRKVKAALYGSDSSTLGNSK